MGIADVWDERNGLLWAQPFEKVSQMVLSEDVAQSLHFALTELVWLQAYHAHEIAVMYQPSLGTFRFRVLIESLMLKQLADYGKSETAR